MFRRCDEYWSSLKQFGEDGDQLLEEDRICCSATQKIYIITQLGRNTQLDRDTYHRISRAFQDCRLGSWSVVAKLWGTHTKVALTQPCCEDIYVSLRHDDFVGIVSRRLRGKHQVRL